MSFDDMPVGQHKQMDIAEHPESTTDIIPSETKSLPLLERSMSKNFKVRLDAISEIFILFSSSETSSDIYLEYYPHFTKYLSDSNARVQEKAVDSFLILLDRLPSVDQTLGEITKTLIEKCISSKGQLKEKAVKLLIELSKIETNQSIIKDSIKETLTIKTPPKVSAGALYALTQLLINYGNSYYPIKVFVGLVAALGESTNSQVRAEVLSYLKEAYKWDKTTIKKAIEGLRQAQKEELKNSFNEIIDTPKALCIIKGETTITESLTDRTVDSYMEAVEVSVLKKFGDNWCNQIMAMKKWTEKKDKLEDLLKAISVERIKYEPFPELGKTIKLLLQDSNIVVVNLTLKVIGQLAKSLRNNFANYSKSVFEFVVQKYKDKKSVIEAQKCMENLVYSLKLEDTLELIKEKLDDKSPIIKSKICLWVGSVVIPKASSSLMKSIGTALGQMLMKLTDDASSEVREEALNCIGALKGFFEDDSSLNKLISELNAQKQEKIIKAAKLIKEKSNPQENNVEEVKVQNDRLKRQNSKNIPNKLKTTKDKKEPTQDVNDEQNSNKVMDETIQSKDMIEELNNIKVSIEEEKEDNKIRNSAEYRLNTQGSLIEEGTIQSEDSIETKRILNNTPSTKTKRDISRKNTVKLRSSELFKTSSNIEEDLGSIISLEDATKTIIEFLPSEILEQLNMTGWKDRLKGIQEINMWIQNNIEKTQESLEVIIVWFKSQVKDFKESNQGIIKESLVLVQQLATSCVIDKKFAYVMVPALIERLNDLKLAETCVNILLYIADSATPSYIAIMAIKSASSLKGINIIRYVISLLHKMLNEYGANFLPLKTTVEYVKGFLSHASPQVRNPALTYITTVYSIIGDIIKPWLNDIKETTYKTLEIEFAKTKPQLQTELKRVLKGDSADYAAKFDKKSLIDTLAPRVNIAGQITAKVLAGLSDSAMKQRQEAKEVIEKILINANNRILPNGINPLIIALKGRMEEPCKNLTKGFITLVGNLALALGQGFRQYSKIIIQPLMWNLADKQTAIRAETLNSMEKIVESIGPEFVLNNVGPLLERENPEARIALLTWTLKNKEALGRCDRQSLVVPLVSVMQDKTKEVRELAEQVIKEIILNTGIDLFNNAIQDLKPAIKNNIQSVLDKYKFIGRKCDNTVNEDNKFESPSTAGTSVNYKNSILDVSLKCTENFHMKSSSVFVSPDKAKIDDSISLTEKSSPNNINPTQTIKKRKESKKLTKQITPNSNKTKKNSELQLNNEPMILCTLGNKEKRAEVDKQQKWIIKEIREDQLEKLKKILKGIIQPNLFDSMFVNQFKKNISALNILTEGLRTEFVGIVDLLDLLFKWILTKMLDQNNPQMLKAIMGFLLDLFKKLSAENYRMLDFEAVIIFPMLADQISAANSGVKQQVKELLKLSSEIYDPGKIISYILNVLENTNSLKTRLDCLGLLQEFTVKYNASKIYASKDIKVLAKLIGSPDSLLKTEALELLNEIYKIYGESIWTILDDLTKENMKVLRKKLIPSIDGEITVNLIKDSEKKSQEDVDAVKEFKNLDNKTDSPIKLNEDSITIQDSTTNLKDNKETTDIVTKVLNENVNIEETKDEIIDSIPNDIAPVKINEEITQREEVQEENVELEEEVKSIDESKELKEKMNLELVSQSKPENVINLGGITTDIVPSVNSPQEIIESESNIIISEPKEVTDKVHSNISGIISVIEQEEIKVSSAEKISTKVIDISKEELSQLIKDSDEQNPFVMGNKIETTVSFSLETSDKRLEFSKKCNAINTITDNNSILKCEIPETQYRSIPHYNLQFHTTEKVDVNFDISNTHRQSLLPNTTKFLTITELQRQDTSTIDNLNQALIALKNTNLHNQANSLIYINERLINSQTEIIDGDNVFETFTETLKILFNKLPSDIPVRFLKYFCTVIVNACSNQSITLKLLETSYSHFIEQLLKILSYEGLELLGNNNEGNYVSKAFNLALFRIIESADPNASFAIFLNLLPLYQNINTMAGNVNISKITGIIIKCLLKLSKTMNPSINASRLLLSIHEYLTSTHQKNELGIRIVKPIINELVKIKGTSILEDYQIIESHSKTDMHIKRWMSVLLQPIVVESKVTTGSVWLESPEDLKEIFRRLNSRATFQDAIKGLKAYIMHNPEVDIGKYFTGCSKAFKDYVMIALGNCEVQGVLGDATQYFLSVSQEEVMTNTKPSISSASEYKSKLEMLRQKFDIGKDN